MVYSGLVIKEVTLSRGAKKDLTMVPQRIGDSFRKWVSLVEEQGLEEVRKIPGYHDEPLRGARAGQRSIRLNISYRAIYVVTTAGVSIQVIEIHNHNY